APADARVAAQPSSRPQRPKFQLRAGVDPAAVDFGPLGYAAAGRESYPVFARLKREGIVPEHCRFQVSLPTPITPITAFTTLEAASLVEPAYETAMRYEVAELAQSIPPGELAIQWDCSWEMAIWEGEREAPFPNPREGVIERLVRLGGWVPPD